MNSRPSQPFFAAPLFTAEFATQIITCRAMRTLWGWVVTAAILSTSVGYAVQVGDTRAAVIAELGTPVGEFKIRGQQVLSYSAGFIKFKDGLVVEVDAGFHDRVQQKEDAEVFADAQRAKGLVNYAGRWMTPENAIKAEKASVEADRRSASLRQKALAQAEVSAKAQAPVPAGSKINVVRGNGQNIDLSSVLKPGKVIIVDFFADWCGPCKLLSPQLEQLAAKNPDVYLCKIDIVDWKKPIVKQFNLHGIPDVRVYDRSGHQVGEANHDYGSVAAAVEKSLK